MSPNHIPDEELAERVPEWPAPAGSTAESAKFSRPAESEWGKVHPRHGLLTADTRVPVEELAPDGVRWLPAAD